MSKPQVPYSGPKQVTIVLSGDLYQLITKLNLKEFGCANTHDKIVHLLEYGLKTKHLGAFKRLTKPFEVGDKIGLLTVISEPYLMPEEQAATKKKQKHRWHQTCRCVCGTTTEVSINNLLNHTRSCGCLRGIKHYVTYKGEKLGVTTACRKAGLKAKSVVARQLRTKCSYQEAFDYFVERSQNRKNICDDQKNS